MGMDVYGKAPTSEKGSYFRNNVWWWRPLWDYCLENHPSITEGVENGHYNDGDGLDADGAAELGRRLLEDISSGFAEKWQTGYREYIASLPRVTCTHCEGTGIRTDNVGVEMGFHTQELEPELAILTGRTHGWCNGCRGEGTKEPWGAQYPFSVENLREFAEFLVASGGFEIW